MCSIFQSRDRSGVFAIQSIHREVRHQVPFVPSQAQLEGWVSTDRLSKYAAAPEDTVALYMWNAELTGAFFELIGHVEVLLRNVVHAQLAPHSTHGAWYDDPYYRFNTRSQREIATAKGRAGRGGRQVTSGRVVAELTFGFWRYLLTSHHQSTVWPRVQAGFQGVPRHERSRQELETVVARVHDLRNRVAHHEPIFHTNVAQHFADLTFIAGYVDAQAPQWLWETSRVHALMVSRPGRP
ncbi:hypothetical protein BJF77_18815 [Kocuria sp. CNJ-770]|jgi:hypothetical protein|nr:hypothetical protein BJF77_18815 [Kocuria sp. CNJ-770]